MNRITVSVDSMPLVGLLRPAIEAALAGRPWPSGPEKEIGAVVAEFVARSEAGQGLPEASQANQLERRLP